MTEITLFGVETNYRPNSIKLSWSLSSALQTSEHLIIRRALTTYPKTPNDGSLVVDTTTSISEFEDSDLEDNRYYYYSIFVKNVSTGEFTEFSKPNTGFALAYKAWNSQEELYRLFPEETRALDEQVGGDLKRLCIAIGNMLDLYRSEVFVMEYNRKPEKAPDNLLDFFSESFGFPAERGIDLNTLRRIGEGIVSVYKRKGTVPAIKDFVKLFTEFDSKILETDTPNFKTWDTTSRLTRSTLTSVGPGFAKDTTSNWQAEQWIGGLFQDQEQDRDYEISNNNNDTIFLNGTPPAIVFDTGTTGQGVNDVITATAGNITAITGVATSGEVNKLVAFPLSVFPDDYWNMSYCIMTSGTNIGKRQIIKSFDSNTGTIILDASFPVAIAPGDTFKLERYLHVFLPGVTGYYLNELAGRTLTVTAGTNNGQSSKIARNYEFDGGTHIVLSIPFTEVTDVTSSISISNTGLYFKDTSKSWTPDEWNGYKITINGTEVYGIIGNTSDTLYLSSRHINLGSPSSYKFDNLYTAYPTATNSYSIDNQFLVGSGHHYFMHSDLTPPDFIGSSRDPGQFIFGGSVRNTANVGGVGEFDLPIVLLDAVEEIGRSTDISGSTLFDSSAFFTPNALIGLRLNPNSQQLVDYEIIANTANTITVSGNLELAANRGNTYYVMTKEVSIKTKRLSQTIPQFLPYNLRPVITHERS